MLTDSESRWIDAYLKPRYPELVPLYLEARTIASAAKVSTRLTEADELRLLELATSTRTPLGENVAAMLGELAAAIPEAQNAVAKLAAGRQVHSRINALVALESFPASPLHVRLIGELLRDKSQKVRALAADKALIFRLRELLPILDWAQRNETNEKVREELAFSLSLLRDGYRVKERGDGTVSVTCRTSAGTVSRFFSEAQFESEGKPWISEHSR